MTILQQASKEWASRPMETLWDITTGMTAFARGLTNTDSRVEIEREAGKVLQMAA